MLLDFACELAVGNGVHLDRRRLRKMKAPPLSFVHMRHDAQRRCIGQFGDWATRTRHSSPALNGFPSAVVPHRDQADMFPSAGAFSTMEASAWLGTFFIEARFTAGISMSLDRGFSLGAIRLQFFLGLAQALLRIRDFQLASAPSIVRDDFSPCWRPGLATSTSYRAFIMAVVSCSSLNLPCARACSVSASADFNSRRDRGQLGLGFGWIELHDHIALFLPALPSAAIFTICRLPTSGGAEMVIERCAFISPRN